VNYSELLKSINTGDTFKAKSWQKYSLQQVKWHRINENDAQCVHPEKEQLTISAAIFAHNGYIKDSSQKCPQKLKSN